MAIRFLEEGEEVQGPGPVLPTPAATPNPIASGSVKFTDQDNGFVKGLFPNTAGLPDEEFESGYQMAAVNDVFSFLTRSAEGIKRMATGQGIQGLVSAMQDPNASIFQESREENKLVWDNLANEAPNEPMKKFYQALGLLGQIGYGGLEDPSTYATLGASSIAKLPRIGAKGIPTEQLFREGMPLTPSQAGDVSGAAEAVETYAQANPFTAKIPAAIKAQQVQKLEETAANISRKMGGQDVQQIGQGGSVRGSLIEQKIKDFENINSSLFAKGEDFIQSKIGSRPVNLNKVDVFSPTKKRLVNAQGMPINKILTQVYKSNATQKMEGMLESIGHKPGSTPQNIGAISEGTIKQAEKYFTQVSDAKSIGELLNVRRNIADEVFNGVNKGTLFGEKNIGFLRRINGELNDAIEESIKAVSPGVEGEQIAGVFRSMNKQYETNLDAVMATAKKLSIGRDDIKFEDVIGKIKLIGTKNLRKLQQAARVKPEVAPIYEEIQRGAYEDLIAKSLNRKTMEISPDKLATAWNSMDNGLKEALFPPQVLGETNKLVKTLQKIYAGDISKINPSGTTKGLTFVKTVNDLRTMVTGVLSYPVIKKYYKTGKLPHQSIWNRVIGPDGKFYLTTNMVKKINQSATLGNFIRSANRKEK